MKNVIAYIGIILLTVYVEIMYVQFYGTTLLAFEILLFLAMFLLSWYFKRSVTAGLKVRIPAGAEGRRDPGGAGCKKQRLSSRDKSGCYRGGRKLWNIPGNKNTGDGKRSGTGTGQ